MDTLVGKLYDDATQESTDFVVSYEGGKICIAVKGYGDSNSNDGKGIPIEIEKFDGRLQVLVWGDINHEEPTDVINVEGARETNRKE